MANFFQGPFGVFSGGCRPPGESRVRAAVSVEPIYDLPTEKGKLPKQISSEFHGIILETVFFVLYLF